MGRVFFNTRKNVVDIAAAYTVLPSDSGTVFMINQASAYKISMPNASAALDGFEARFIVGTVGSYAVTVECTDDDADNMYHRGLDLEDAAQTAGTGGDVITFISGAIKGDECTWTCDGTSWYVISVANQKAHITTG